MWPFPALLSLELVEERVAPAPPRLEPVHGEWLFSGLVSEYQVAKWNIESIRVEFWL
jgi:hypothetical protein